MRTKVNLIKQISFILLVTIGSSLISGCEVTTRQEIKSIISNIKEEPEIVAVRAYKMDDGVILGDLIDTGLIDTVWEIYDPAEDGNKYVTISGNVLYEGTLVVVKLQYQIYDDEKIEFASMEYNDVPQDEKNTTAMLNYLKKEYEAIHGAKK